MCYYPDQFPTFSPPCVNVTPLSFDEEISASTIEPNASGNIAVIGGNGEYMWTISGKGFFLDADHSSKTLLSSTQTITVYANEEACGTGHISVTDGCTIEEYSVVSSKGRWGVAIGGGWGQRYGVHEFVPGKLALCGTEGSTYYQYSASTCMESDNGIYRQEICYATIGGCGTHKEGCSPSRPVGLCGDFCITLQESMPRVGEAVKTSPYFTSYKVIDYQQCFTNMPATEVNYWSHMNHLNYRSCGCHSYSIVHAAYQKWECDE